jgi:hypothetical protein
VVVCAARHGNGRQVTGLPAGDDVRNPRPGHSRARSGNGRRNHGEAPVVRSL